MWLALGKCSATVITPAFQELLLSIKHTYEHPECARYWAYRQLPTPWSFHSRVSVVCVVYLTCSQ